MSGSATNNPFRIISEQIWLAILELYEQGKIECNNYDEIRKKFYDVIAVEPPKDESHGEIATNAAMILAKPLAMKPRELAELLIAEISKQDYIADIAIAGPGFVNISLKAKIWQQQIIDIIKSDHHYGDGSLGDGSLEVNQEISGEFSGEINQETSRKINIEYVSANPTGPMHVGHMRGAVVGDVLANLLEKQGYDVTREYYINDAGAQIEVLAKSALIRYRQSLGEQDLQIPQGLYPGEYLVAVGEVLKSKYGGQLLYEPENVQLQIASEIALQHCMQLIKEDLAALGVKHDVFVSESELVAQGRVDEAIAALEEQGLIYQGVLPPPKGKEVADWESEPQLLFRSSDFGDDSDRAIQKSDGSWAYFAPDIAYHYDKYQRGFNEMINVFGADHGGYVKRISAAVTALSSNQASLKVLLCQLVKLMKAGQPLKMSKRSGSFVTLREVVDEVGKDAARFMMMMRKSDAPLDFDLEQAVAYHRDNPVFYVQYAYARCCSVIRMARDEIPKDFEEYLGADFDIKNAKHIEISDELLFLLDSHQEIALIRMMANWPRIVTQAARSLEPHRVAFYLQELAALFHNIWHEGSKNNRLRFIQIDHINLTKARLALVIAVSYILREGFLILSIDPVEEM